MNTVAARKYIWMCSDITWGIKMLKYDEWAVPGEVEYAKRKAAEIMSCLKIRAFDSLHIASAEVGNADVFLTTDDKLEKMAEKLELGTRVINPLRFAWEVI